VWANTVFRFEVVGLLLGVVNGWRVPGWAVGGLGSQLDGKSDWLIGVVDRFG